MEIKMLNAYQSLRREHILKQEETEEMKETVMIELQDFFNQQVHPHIGH